MKKFSFFKKTKNDPKLAKNVRPHSGPTNQKNQNLEQVLAEYQAKPSLRLFHVGKESYIIFSGSSIEDQTPYIIIGDSFNLPLSIQKHIEYLLISDNFLGNVIREENFYREDSELLLEFGKFRFVGDEKNIKSLLQYFDINDIEYLVPAQNFRKKSGIAIHPKEQTPQGSIRARILALFYENGNIKVNAQKKNIFDLSSRLRKDITFANELQFTAKIFSKQKCRSLNLGFLDSGGDLMFHHQRNFFALSLQNHAFIPLLVLYGMDIAKFKGVFFKNHGYFESVLHSLGKIHAKPHVYTKNEKLYRYLSLLASRTPYTVTADNDILKFSNFYEIRPDLLNEIFYISMGKRSIDFEVNLPGKDVRFNSNIVVTDKITTKIPKERQLFLVREDFPQKAFSPYVLSLPQNYRYEFRWIRKISDVDDLNLELAQWLANDNDILPRPIWRSFAKEVLEIVSKLFDNVFQVHDLQLERLGSWRKKLKWYSPKEAWKILIIWNRHFLRWQLSGKKTTFEMHKVLHRLRMDGFIHFGLVIIMEDGQALTLYLPELNPMAYFTGMENPLSWQEKDILHDKAYAILREKIVQKDVIHFLKSFDQQTRGCPLSDLEMNSWRDSYAQWIEFFINGFAKIIQDTDRLLDLHGLLQEQGTSFNSWEEKLELQRQVLMARKEKSEQDKQKQLSADTLKSKVSDDPYLENNEKNIKKETSKENENSENNKNNENDKNDRQKQRKQRLIRKIIRNRIQQRKKQITQKIQHNKRSLIGGALLMCIGFGGYFLWHFWFFTKINKIWQNPSFIENIEKSTQDGLSSRIVEEKINISLLPRLKKQNPSTSFLSQYFQSEFNYGPSILRYLDRMAVINGYRTLSKNTAKEKPVSDSTRYGGKKNPHWIYPNKKMTKPDGSVWLVTKGDSFWKISRQELERRNKIYLYYLSIYDITLKVWSQKYNIADHVSIALDKTTQRIVRPPKIKNLSQKIQKQLSGNRNVLPAVHQTMASQEYWQTFVTDSLPPDMILGLKQGDFAALCDRMQRKIEKYSFASIHKEIFSIRTIIAVFLNNMEKN